MKSAARLRTVSREEIRWRLRARARIWRDRMRARVRAPRWDRGALRRVLDPRVFHPLQDACARRDWMTVHRDLAQHLGQRPIRFVLDPAAAPAMRQAMLARWPGAADDARARADRLMAGRHDLLGYRDLVFTSRRALLDWHLDPVHGRRPPRRFWADVPYLNPECGDHKIIWELNRHQHWLALGRALWLTGDRRYRSAIVDQLSDWLAANPPLTGINWASMLEIGFRSIAWLWALHILLGDARADEEKPWLVDLLVGLDRQLTHVEENLSYYFSPNTHLTGEALALYVAGTALPELAASARRAETGRRVLLAEIDRQILPDGGHVERSTHYHRYTLDFYVLALLVADRSGDGEAADRFRDAVARLAVFLREIADDAGRIPLIGDDDGGMLWPFTGPAHADVRASLSAAAAVLNEPALAPWPLPEEAYWVAWREACRLERSAPAPATATPPDSARVTAFPDTGYIAMRDGAGGHAILDAGPHGYLNGGHAHADALALTLTVGGRPWLVDPGTATYVMDRQLRDRLRLSTSHNTITVDGRSFAVPAGPFHWAATTDAAIETWRTNPRFGWAEAAHAGYPGVRHRRGVLASTIGWCVVDHVEGTGAHRADAVWHVDPEWTVQIEGATCVRARHADGRVGWLLCEAGDVRLTRGDGDVGGWCSRSYGAIEPAWTARVTRHGTLPLVFVTWMLPGTHDSTPHLHRLPRGEDGDPRVVAVHLRDGALESFLVVQPHDAVRAPVWSDAGPYRTDGRLLHACRRERRVSLDLVDATSAMATGDDWISVSACGERVRDLHVSLANDRVEIWTAARPAALELRGSRLHDARSVRMNGREVPFRLAAGVLRLTMRGDLTLACGSVTA